MAGQFAHLVNYPGGILNVQPDMTLTLEKTLPGGHIDQAQQSAIGVFDLSIVIVNWNTQQVIIECLESVYALLGELHAEVIVIDISAWCSTNFFDVGISNGVFTI